MTGSAPAPTGVLQSALGNLPELFICIFALRAGLVDVVKAALIGSVLANLLFVLGLAFLVGGLKHGTQRLDSERARTIAVLMLLSVVGDGHPVARARTAHAGRRAREGVLDHRRGRAADAVRAVTPGVAQARFGGRRPTRRGAALARRPGDRPAGVGQRPRGIRLATGSSTPLEPAMESLDVSQVFAGLVVVAIAGNAIENIVGVQLAAKGQSEYAFAVILNSPTVSRIALVLAPALVLISVAFGALHADARVQPAARRLPAAVGGPAATVITIDGESNWLEGASLIALYAVIAVKPSGGGRSSWSCRHRCVRAGTRHRPAGRRSRHPSGRRCRRIASVAELGLHRGHRVSLGASVSRIHTR